MTPLTHDIAVLSYPLAPANVDAAAWQPGEAPPPLLVSMTMPECSLVPQRVRVGWWDESRRTWSEDGINGVEYDRTSRQLSFSTTRLGHLAVLQDIAAELPHCAWTLRPTAGSQGAAAELTVALQLAPGSNPGNQIQQKSSCNGSDSSTTASGGSSTVSKGSVEKLYATAADVVLQVTQEGVTLLAPDVPELSHLLHVTLPPWQLLSACSAAGLPLAVDALHARAAGLQVKEPAVERAMAADLALVA